LFAFFISENNQYKRAKIMKIIIRDEQLEDIPAITELTRAAFQNTDHSSHTEQFIVNALRTHGQLTISLVALENNQLVGHVAISPVSLQVKLAGTVLAQFRYYLQSKDRELELYLCRQF